MKTHKRDRRASTGTSAIENNIRTIADMQDHLERSRGTVDRTADLIGGFSGSMTFVMLHMGWFLIWFLLNTGVITGVKKFDPYPFMMLGTIVSVEAVILSTFVLMKQNRMQRQSDTRDHLCRSICWRRKR